MPNKNLQQLDKIDLELTGKAADEFEKQIRMGPTKKQKEMMTASREAGLSTETIVAIRLGEIGSRSCGTKEEPITEASVDSLAFLVGSMPTKKGQKREDPSKV